MGLDCYLFGIKENVKNIEDPRSGEWEEICYWRKANQIHKWFNVRFIKNQDPWGFYEVSEIDIQGLLLVCKLLMIIKEETHSELSWWKTDLFKVIEKNAKDVPRDESCIVYDCADYIAEAILPPDNLGCFFGSGLVDEWYWEQIDDTIEMLEHALEQGYSKYFYMASW